jgi:Flp pilus assembly protein TadB
VLAQCNYELVRRSADQPVVITDVPLSSAEEFAKRRKRYTILMALRALCVIVAALVYQQSVLLALAFIVGGAVLPWCAVLIANDRLPTKHRTRPAALTVPVERALPPAGPDSGARTVPDGDGWQNPVP